MTEEFTHFFGLDSEIVIIDDENDISYARIKGINSIRGYLTILYGSKNSIVAHVIDYGGDIAQYFSKKTFRGFILLKRVENE